jgi:hypothetical protein
MKIISIFIFGIMTAVSLQARVLRVPAQFPTIQSGIDAAIPGDTILVAEGIYFEQINLSGKKPIVLASNFIMDGNDDHIVNTVLDGSHLPVGLNMSVIYFGAGNDSTTVLSGFTIRAGRGTQTTGTSGTLCGGGGIFIEGGGAKIVNNLITHNGVNDASFVAPSNLACAGGIYVATEPEDYWTVISNNEISHNQVAGSHQSAYGGGLSLGNNARVSNNLIRGNTTFAVAEATDLQGGGIAVVSALASKQLYLDGNVIDSNLLECPTNINGLGGGIALSNLVATVVNNEILNNRIEILVPPASAIGAGMNFEYPAGGSVVTGNRFEGNEGTRSGTSVTTGSAGGALNIDSDQGSTQLEISNNRFISNKADRGGAIQSYGMKLNLYNNLFINNEASSIGGAIFLIWDTQVDSTHQVLLANNTFRKNFAEFGGAVGSYGSSPLVLNSIFDGDSSWSGSNEFYVHSGEGNIELYNSDLDTISHGNAMWGYVIRGSGLIYADPAFTDFTTLQIEHWSPCVDAGAAMVTCTHGQVFNAPPFDMNGVPRPVGDGYDMGAYDTDAWPLGIEQNARVVVQISNLPNPVVSTTKFKYNLSESGNAEVRIYSEMGKLVAMPLNGYEQRGLHEITWDASGLPAGIYFYRLHSAKGSATGKMIKL